MGHQEVIADFIGYTIPWQLWLVPGAAASIGAFFFLWRFLGTRDAAISAAVIAGLSALLTFGRRERQAGWKAKTKKEIADGKKLVERADRAGRTVLDAPAERLRDDDGFKRGE